MLSSPDSVPVALPPRYALTVLIALLDDAEGTVPSVLDVDNAALATATGYSTRSLQLAWQRIGDAGVAQVGRSHGGRRRLIPVPDHCWWTIAAAMRTAVTR